MRVIKPNNSNLATFSRLKPQLLPLISMALGIALVGLITLAAPPFADLEAKLGLQLLFRLRGPISPPPEVVVVTIDQESSQQLALPNLPRKWPRRRHAQLVSKLSTAGAAVIGFDMIFTEAQTPENDQAFEAAIRKAGNVLLFAKMVVKQQAEFRQEQLIPPRLEFQQAARDIAPFMLPKVPEVIMQAWLFKSTTGDNPTLPSVALQWMAQPFRADFYQQLKTAAKKSRIPLEKNIESLLLNPSNEPPSQLLSELKHLLLQHPQLGPSLQSSIHQIPAGKKHQMLSAWLTLLTTSPSIYLNFYGPARTITTIPYHQVLAMDTESLSQTFHGKAVLVGFSERFQPEQKDGFYTVFTRQDGLDISGVEIMATTLANLIENTAIRPASTHIRLAVVVLFAILGSVLLLYSRGWILVLLTGVLIILWLLLALWLFRTNEYWIPITTPLLFQLPVSLIVSLLCHYFIEATKHQRTQNALKQYIPKHVAQKVSESRIPYQNQAGECQFASCLATDAEAYTRLAEHLPPGQLHHQLNQYFQLLFPPVHHSNGLVMDIVGDAMLALWREGDQNRLKEAACIAAIKIRDNLQGRPAGTIPTRLGLHCGEVSMGNIGSREHIEYRAVGDVINTTSRIENLNKILGSQILASAHALDFEHPFLTRPLGSFRLRGKADPLEIYELFGFQNQANEEQLALVDASHQALTAFHDREFQVAALLFNRIAKRFNDGPARFFYQYCSRPSTPGKPDTIITMI